MPERQTLEHLLSTLQPKRRESLQFICENTHPDGFRVYGGQVLAQALAAAVATVPEDRKVHSQHAYFLRPGNPREPITMDVEESRDGGTFSSRRVVASQKGKPILVSSLSFQVPEFGDSYEAEMPQVPGPEGLETERDREIAEGWLNPDFMIVTGTDLDVRVVEPIDWANPSPRDTQFQAWMRTTGPVGNETGLQEALIAYMSDAFLVDVALITCGKSFMGDDMQIASLDHALWFNQPARADEWLLFVADAERVGGGRGLARGRFYTEDGRLVATCMQESLLRKLQ